MPADRFFYLLPTGPGRADIDSCFSKKSLKSPDSPPINFALCSPKTGGRGQEVLMGYCDVCQSAGSVNRFGFCEICGTSHEAGNRANLVADAAQSIDLRDIQGVLTTG